MNQNLHENPFIRTSKSPGSEEVHFITLYNDDFNTFEFVIKCLVEICDHSPEQAEQCATITHFKGKCEIKKGKKNELLPMQMALVRRNLKAEIE